MTEHKCECRKKTKENSSCCETLSVLAPILFVIVLLVTALIGGYYARTSGLTEIYIGTVTEVKNDVRGGAYGGSETGYIILDGNRKINVHDIDSFNWEIGKKYKIVTQQDTIRTYYYVKSAEILGD